jgi:molecular chaperone DnaJ
MVSLDEYYKRLGLPSGATAAEVKRAYRRLRAKYHPDRNKGEESAVEPTFKRVQEAFEVLTGKREPAPLRASAKSHAAHGAHATNRPAEAAHRNHAKDDAMRQPQSRAYADAARTARPAHGPSSSFASHSGPLPVRGTNRHTQLYVPLEVAMNGGNVPANYQVTATCRQCNGSSAPHMAEPCASCGGRGRLHDATVCPACTGRGRIRNTLWCAACQNKGVELLPKSDAIAVPAGAWDGQRLVVAGGGFPGLHGGAPGDAIFTIAIICGSDFQREGLDLSGEIEVDFVIATLGGTLEAKVLGRDLCMTIPPNAQHGSVIRLPAHGLADSAGNRGELKLRIVLVMPNAASHLTHEQRRIFQDLFADAARRSSEAA